ncbi:hypothetical protein Tco_0601566 [Tanacetum coccineum]
MKDARYDLVGIEDMILKQWSILAQQILKTRCLLSYEDSECGSVKVNKLHGYSYLEEIVVRRADRQLYKFKEGDFVNLHLNDIEDMLLLVVQHKLFHLDGDAIVDLAVAMRYSTFDLDTTKTCLEKVVSHESDMVDLIDKQMLERRIIRNLERLVGARKLEMDYRRMQRTV